VAKDFKELLNGIRCGEISPSTFTEDDLNQVKACLPPAEKPEPESGSFEPTFDESCLPAALQEAEAIIKDSLKNTADLNELAIVRGRLDEVQQNLLIIQTYFAERLSFFLRVSNSINPLTAEILSIDSNLLTQVLSGQSSSAQALALINRRQALRQQISTISTDSINQYSPIPSDAFSRQAFTTDVTNAFRIVSGKINAQLANNSIITIQLRFKELITATYKEGQTDKTVFVKNSRFLLNQNAMATIQDYIEITSATQNQDSSDINSKLYDGTGGYMGLYKTLREPIKNLFSLEERGLTLSLLEIDPLLRANPDLPKSFKEDDRNFFIRNLTQYQTFFETLGTTLPPRIQRERETVYPAEILTNIEAIKAIARREAAHHLRTGSIVSTLSQDTVFDKKTYKAGNNALSKTLNIYREAALLVDQRIDVITAELENLDLKIKDATGDPSQVEAKIMDIPCFGNPAKQAAASGNPGNCEGPVNAKRGTDPFAIRTLAGTDASLPDMTSPCYWKYFAEELTLMGLFPIPDLTAPIFRYYPVNGVIPAFPGPIILTLPQKWKVLSVISSPIGTIVPMISLPITAPSPIPIPLPSIYVFYLAPDGNKYMIFAPNLPFLIQPNQAKLGFSFDTSAINPLGLKTPYSGLPIKGALSIPLKISAANSKATRLAKLAIDLAQGKVPSVQMPNGKAAPGDLGEVDANLIRNQFKSGDEVGLESAETTPAKDFDRLVTKIRDSINKQIDSFGDFATDSLQAVKQEISDARAKGKSDAQQVQDSKKRREDKAAARSIDPVNLEVKIKALIDEANKLIDNLTLGEIIYPDDPSKLNPHLSAAITSIADLVEMAGRGELKTERDSDLVKKIRRVSNNFNTRLMTTKERFNLEDEGEFTEFKEVLERMAKDSVEYLQGKPKPANTSEARNESESQQIAEADKEMQDLLVKTLSFTAIALSSPPKISVFNPSKPCCETSSDSLFNGVPPEALAVLSIFSSLMAALISNVTVDDIKALLNVQNVRSIGVDQIKDLFKELLNQLPAIKLPKAFNAAALIGSLIVPILSAISLPEIPLPGKPVLPVQIKIPLDAIIKPLLKLALAALIQAILRLMADLINSLTRTSSSTGRGVNSTIDIDEVIRELDCGAFGIVTLRRIRSNQVEITLPNGSALKLPVFPDIPLDILGFFGFMMNTDVISFLKGLINAALDSILNPIAAIVRPILSLVPNGSWSSLTPLDLANPIALIIKQIKITLEDSIGKGLKISLINAEVYPIVLAAAIPVLEALEKGLKEVAYIGAAVLCSTGGAGVQVARLAHPIFNQDDLPPWERLTRKNPLFAIFLDEILHRSTIMSLGTLIFYTKLPGMYGVTVVPSLFIPPPRV